METLAFNSADGDYFGLTQDILKAPKTIEAEQRWYRRAWNVVKQTSSVLYSVVYNILFLEETEFSETILPPGTNAIGGLVNRRKQIALPKQQKGSFYEPTGRINNEGKSGIFPCLEGKHWRCKASLGL
jgi:hypothetical protein